MDFNYYLPVNIIFGCGKIDTVGLHTVKYGKKAFVVTGKNSTKKTGLLDYTISKLKEAGVETVVFDKAIPNPTTIEVYAGVKTAKENKCDVVLALGGGSIIDCAKAIAFSFYNEGDIFEYIYGVRSGNKALPLIAIPTTCGTGSEGNCFAVLTNPENKDKKSLRNMASVPCVSIIDPELMVTMPAKVASAVMFDALCHNIEAYVAKSTQPLVEMQALYAIELLGKNMIKAYHDYSDMDAWSKVSFASTLGGMCINMAGVTAPHGMEHPASGLRNIVHGRGLAALAPVIYEESLDYAPDKFLTMAKLLGGKTKEDFLNILDEILIGLDIKTSLSKEGVKKEDVPWMTENCLKVSAPAINGHPRLFSKDEIEELYYRAI